MSARPSFAVSHIVETQHAPIRATGPIAMHSTMTTATNTGPLAGPSFTTALYGFLSTTVVTTGLLFLLSSL